MTPEAHGAAAVDRHADPRAPAQPVHVAGHRLDLDFDLQAGQARQLFGDPEGLEPPLGREVDVLEVAAAAASGPGVRAGRRDAVGGGGQDLDGVRPQVGGRFRGDPGPHPLAGEGMADEHDLAVGRPGHAPAAGGDGPHFELQEGRGLGGCHGR